MNETDPATVSDARLQAYVDGRLPPHEQASAQAWLAARPRHAQRIAQYRALTEQIAALWPETLRERVPRRLLRPLRRSKRRRPAAVAALWLFLGGMGAGSIATYLVQDWGLRADSLAASSQLVQRAALAHQLYVRDADHLAERTAQNQDELLGSLSRRLGMKVQAPRLEPAGLTLIGGRLVPGKTAAMAMLMYQGSDGRRVTVFWAPDTTRARDTNLLYSREAKVRTYYWLDRECGYAVVSTELKKDELAHVAQMAHDQLEK